MPRHDSCPDLAHLKDLIDGALPDDERAALTAHLDGCESCQRRLEETAAGGSGLFRAAVRVRERPPAESAYWNALKRVEGTTPVPGWAESPVATRLETPPPESGTSGEIALEFLQPSGNPEFLGTLDDHFDIVRVIGKGGMGIVLEALDRCLQRRVAIKVLNPEFAANETAKERFWREAKAAAAVTHENVVAIHQVVDCECGSTAGLPYLVMQLITGTSLEDHIAAHGPLPLTDILRIGAQAAAGLAAAHRQGLIHRDIKPANILLESDLQRAKLTDFGLARAAEDVRLTQTGFVPGTPLYMAPEQARGDAVDHRADLFSLGSVLYVMSTGQPPFQGSTPYVVLKNVTEEQPPAIASINPEVPSWLVDIIGKLHAKKPEDRVDAGRHVPTHLQFKSASEVAETLSRALRKIEHLTEDQKKACAKAAALRRTVDLGRRRFLWMGLGVLLGAGGTLAGAALRRRVSGAAGDEAASVAPLATLDAEVGPVWSAAFAPDGQSLAMAIDDGTVKLWDVKARDVRLTIDAHKAPVWSVAFSPDGKLLATSSDDGMVRVWDAATGEERHKFEHPSAVRQVAFAPDGQSLATGVRNGVVRLWSLATRETIHRIEAHGGVVMAVAFAPDGKTVASAGSDKLAVLWDAQTGRKKLELRGHAASVYAVTFSADGRRLATGSWDRSARVWDAGTGHIQTTLTGHALDVWSVAFSPDGKTLASGSEDRTVKLWDVASAKELTTFRGHGSTVCAVAFTRDGKTLASGGRDGTVKLWDPAARA
jgi:WD40 repeat protein/tRNA A-37 threonylcarbamoyl transferase component Bud32